MKNACEYLLSQPCSSEQDLSVRTSVPGRYGERICDGNLMRPDYNEIDALGIIYNSHKEGLSPELIASRMNGYLDREGIPFSARAITEILRVYGIVPNAP